MSLVEGPLIAPTAIFIENIGKTQLEEEIGGGEPKQDWAVG